MTRRRKAAAAISFTFLALVVVATRLAAPMARPALGYVAKTICSDVFVGSHSQAQALADLPDEPVARLIRTGIDTTQRTVRAWIPLVARRAAQYREGYGCTLHPVTGDLAAVSPALFQTIDYDTAAPWPEGERTEPAENEALSVVVANAFAEPDARRLRATRAIVIVQGGRIIAEQYAEGYSVGSRFTGWSMTKSVTSALVGILVGQGRLALTDSIVHDAWRSPGDARGAITLHDLLQMSSGLAFDESYTPSGGATRMLFESPDAAAVAASSAIAYSPGSRWQYSSGTTNIIAQRMRAAIGSDATYHAFPREMLFGPIGMHSAVLEPDPSGTFVGSSFMYATARDWARFGLLYLRDGVWNGARILPEGWVAWSVTPARSESGYGAHWWLNAGTAPALRDWPDLPADLYWASGFNGQYVAVLPSHDLVVVRLGNTVDDGAFDLGDFLLDVIRANPAPRAPAQACRPERGVRCL